MSKFIGRLLAVGTLLILVAGTCAYMMLGRAEASAPYPMIPVVSNAVSNASSDPAPEVSTSRKAHTTVAERNSERRNPAADPGRLNKTRRSRGDPLIKKVEHKPGC